MRTLTREQAKAFYDKFGARQDQQAFYEEGALRTLCANADLARARSVLEPGCGTGRFAFDLLRHHLPADARYYATDISTTMVDLAASRLAPFSPRAAVTLAGDRVAPPVVEPASIDRFIATYVLDLLSADDQEQMLAEARRLLHPDGLLCLTGITPGVTPLSRLVMNIWQWVFERNPGRVGGCRPARISERLPPNTWRIRFHTVVVAFGVASEVVIASPISQGEA